jgi:hypothetical protein
MIPPLLGERAGVRADVPLNILASVWRADIEFFRESATDILTSAVSCVRLTE